MASLHRLRSGKYRVSWHITVRRGPRTGQKVRGSATFTAYTHAQQFRREFHIEEDRIRAGMAIPSIPFAMLVERFVTSPHGLRPRTLTHYKAVYRQFGKYLEGRWPNKTLVLDYLDNRPSVATRNNHLSPLRTVFGFGVSRRLIGVDPTAGIPFIRVDTGEREPPGRREVSRLLRAAPPTSAGESPS